MISQQNKYKVILDNLLEVSNNDSAIFTKVNDKDYFDILSLVRPEDFERICRLETFEVSLYEMGLSKVVTKLKETSNIEDFIRVLKEWTNIKEDEIGQIRHNYLKMRDKVIGNLEVKIQKSLLKWKVLNDKTINILDETNIWPLHLGFLFVSLRKEDKAIYAPLFFKEAHIQFKNGRPYLSSNGDIKINEKLLFFLSNQGFDLYLDDQVKEFEINTLLRNLQTHWNGLYNIPLNIVENFKKFRPDEIQNPSLSFFPGAVLGIFQPGGGFSRTRMKEIIQNGEIDEIIDVEFNKNIYKNKIDRSIFNPNLALFKITESNLSQDRAILSSLNQNTVIWGPPGTGKSQTIVNLIANILVYGKTAIVASQKRAALEVIYQRLNKLNPFALFISNSKEMKKSSFYEPIQNYLEMIENFDSYNQIKHCSTITAQELNFIAKASEYLSDPTSQLVLKAYYYISVHKKDFDFDKEMGFIVDLPKDVFYPQVPFKQGETAKELLKNHDLTFLPFVRKYFELRRLGQEIDSHLTGFTGTLHDLMQFMREIGYDKEQTNNPFDRINELMKLEENISYANTISDEEAIKNVVLERIFKTIANFNEEERMLYREFAQSIRIVNYEPYRFIKKYSAIIKKIFPIIIATPNTDLSGWTKNEFDYAILDESSQIFIENGLPILYLAKRKILAGDTQQMKPNNWFGTRQSDDSIFGQVDSLLDYALSLGVFPILLDKNYRSNHAALMTFSSKHFYNSTLDAIDSATSWSTNPIEVIQVEDGAWENQKNVAEAKKAIEIAIENLDKYEKIIILGFNGKQSDYITWLIFRNHPELEEAIKKRRLLIRNIENIQGDEADLVIATLAYDKNTKIQYSYVARPGGKNALNVAISRAKEKMIVLKTINSSDIPLTPNMQEDLKIFKKWLDFLELSIEGRRVLLKDSFKQPEEIDEILSEKEKWFKLKVYSYLRDLTRQIPNCEIFRDYIVGSMTIDIVITVNKIPYKSFIFDTYNYASKPINYAKMRDKIRFLVSKKYDIEVITPISWIKLQNEILKFFNPGAIRNFYNSSIEGATSTYLLNKEPQIIEETSNEVDTWVGVSQEKLHDATQTVQINESEIQNFKEVNDFSKTVEINVAQKSEQVKQTNTEEYFKTVKVWMENTSESNLNEAIKPSSDSKQIDDVLEQKHHLEKSETTTNLDDHDDFIKKMKQDLDEVNF
ncbi:DEAD/DEAH box helicase [Mycoplasmopsis gallopavonis]|uniref:Putative DNA helicase n=1 Tax=Mycoplasmopsis gallopavonis TaxID=76629 RepID=A0A449B075_9BACT|nr:DEAD/DEAH box helicase [Mycoplasmopsis gallopavonis]RIV16840.1 endonuclease [Mycoplasmopsis gallopavonis]VEU73144.1 putative DNA helicase [Mycoplasmopsis gallopavonis]